MRKTNTCPKCESTEIIRIPGAASAYGAGNNIPAGLTIWSSILVTRLLCAGCGFSEEWIESKEDRAKLKKKYKAKKKPTRRRKPKFPPPKSKLPPPDPE